MSGAFASWMLGLTVAVFLAELLMLFWVLQYAFGWPIKKYKVENEFLDFDLSSQTSGIEVDFLRKVRRRYTLHDIRFVIERLRFYQADFINWQSVASKALVWSVPLFVALLGAEYLPSIARDVLKTIWPPVIFFAVLSFPLILAKDSHARRQAAERVITLLQLALPEAKAIDPPAGAQTRWRVKTNSP